MTEKSRNTASDEVLADFSLKADVLLDEVKAGGRIPLIIGRGLTERARETLGLSHSEIFRKPSGSSDSDKGFTAAQKMVGRACGVCWHQTRRLL